jgi:hypothetical protein
VAFLNLTFVRRDCGIGDTNVKFTPLAIFTSVDSQSQPVQFLQRFLSEHVESAILSRSTATLQPVDEVGHI